MHCSLPQTKQNKNINKKQTKTPLCSIYSCCPNLGYQWCFYSLHSSAISRMHYSWKHMYTAFQFGFFHLVVCSQVSFMPFHGFNRLFLFSTNTPLYVYPFSCWEYLGCFHVPAIMNKAALTICVQIFVWIQFSKRSMTPGSYDNSVCGFVRNCLMCGILLAGA